MKFIFTRLEKQWLQSRLESVVKVLTSMRESTKLASKNRYKFHGNPMVVNLTGKDRAFLASLVRSRMANLSAAGTLVFSGEFEMLQDLILKLERHAE